MVKDHSDNERKPAATTWATLSDWQQGFFYMQHPTDRIAHSFSLCYTSRGALAMKDHHTINKHFYHTVGYMVSIIIMVKNTLDSIRQNLLLPRSINTHRQDSTYHSLCYTSCQTLAGTRNNSVSPPWGFDPLTHCSMSWKEGRKCFI